MSPLSTPAVGRGYGQPSKRRNRHGKTGALASFRGSGHDRDTSRVLSEHLLTPHPGGLGDTVGCHVSRLTRSDAPEMLSLREAPRLFLGLQKAPSYLKRHGRVEQCASGGGKRASIVAWLGREVVGPHLRLGLFPVLGPFPKKEQFKWMLSFSTGG
jgi:hypothetical protein